MREATAPGDSSSPGMPGIPLAATADTVGARLPAALGMPGRAGLPPGLTLAPSPRLRLGERLLARLADRPLPAIFSALFLGCAFLLLLTALLTPGLVRPGVWRTTFTVSAGVAALTGFGGLFVRQVPDGLVLGIVLVFDFMIVLSAAGITDRPGSRMLVALFALTSLYAALCLPWWALLPQAAAVLVGSAVMLVLGGAKGVLVGTGVGVVLVATLPPAVAVVVLRARLRSSLRQARALSTTDPLTGLVNRRGIAERAPAIVRQARRAGLSVGVVVADVDHFKKINDLHGHAVGDEVLRLVADAVCSAVRADDIVVRLGGEEIAVLTAVHAEDLPEVAERIRHQVQVATRPSSVTVSLGVAWADPRERDDPLRLMWSLVDQADDLMYVAKRAGRNRVSLPAEAV